MKMKESCCFKALLFLQEAEIEAWALRVGLPTAVCARLQ